jgi:hypothetical protein
MESSCDSIMNFSVPYNVGKFLSSWATGGFSRTQLHGINLVSSSSQWTCNY